MFCLADALVKPQKNRVKIIFLGQFFLMSSYVNIFMKILFEVIT